MNHAPEVRQPTPWGAVSSLVLAFLYGASPVDVLPDIIPLLGWVDDAVVLPILILIGVVGLVRRSRTGPVPVSRQINVPPVIPVSYDEARAR